MIVHLIVVKHPCEESPWIHSAWDEWTRDGNSRGFEEDLEKAEKTGDVRILDVSIPDDALERAFTPMRVVEGKVLK